MKVSNKNRFIALFLSICFVLSIAVQTTLAYIVAKTLPTQNIFKPYQSIEGDLVISKIVEHPYGEDYVIPDHIEFDFEVELGEFYAGYTLSTTQGEITADENGRLKLAVKPGAPIGIEGIDDGIEVTVTEIQKENDGFELLNEENSIKTVISSEEQTVLEFFNKYTPESVKPDNVKVIGLKILEGREWENGDNFTFVIEHQSDNGEWICLSEQKVMYDSENSEFNTFDFSDIIQQLEFSEIGTYSFRLLELSGELENIVYDETINYFDIFITDDDMDGKLEIQNITAEQNAVVTSDESGYEVNVTFNNIYNPTTTTTSTTTSTTTTTTSTTTSTTTTTTSTTTSTTTTTTSTTTSTTTTTTSTTSTTTTTTSTTTTTTSTTTSTTTTTTSTTTSTTTTTTSTTTTTPVAVESSRIAKIETTHGYYFSHDNRGFNRNQIINVEIEYLYTDGSIDIVNVTDRVDFGSANPENTYRRSQIDFTYKIALYLDDQPLIDENGNAIEVTAYIGVKGDADLNNEVNSLDASTVLTYYAKVQTSPTLDKSIKLSKDDPYLDGLAAFLADVDTNEFNEQNFAREKMERTVNALDASYILTFYAKQQTMPLDTLKYDIWMIVIPERMLERLPQQE